MTPAGLIAKARLLVADFLPDTCSVVSVANAGDGYGGVTLTESTVASDVPCLYEAMTGGPQDIIAGGAMAVVRHRIFLKLDDADVHDIAPEYKIVVDARDDKPELTFIDLRRLDESNEVLLTVSGKLQ